MKEGWVLGSDSTGAMALCKINHGNSECGAAPNINTRMIHDTKETGNTAGLQASCWRCSRLDQDFSPRGTSCSVEIQNFAAAYVLAVDLIR